MQAKPSREGKRVSGCKDKQDRDNGREKPHAEGTVLAPDDGNLDKAVARREKKHGCMGRGNSRADKALRSKQEQYSRPVGHDDRHVDGHSSQKSGEFANLRWAVMIILKSQRRTLDRSLPADVATIGDLVFPTTIVPCTFCKMCNVAVRNDGKLVLR